MPLERASERLRRILVLVPWVIANPGTSLSELCERFSVTQEELSADLELLFVCGLPPFGPGDLIDVSIEGDAVTIRMADYLARPPRLTRGEALALLVMGRALLGLPGLEEASSLRRALDKLAAAIDPAQVQPAVEAAQRIAVELAGAGTDHLAGVRAAIEDRARLRMSYYSESRGAMSEREIDPLMAFGARGQWYVAGFDHASGEERLFRVDRIKELARTGQTFELPEGFDPTRYQSPMLFTPGADDVLCEIDVTPAAGWVKEFVAAEKVHRQADGWTRLTLRTPHFAWLVRLLLTAGPSARAVSPPDLVDAVRDAASRALALYDARGA